MEHNHNEDKDLELKHISKIGDKKYFVSTIKMEVRHNWLNRDDNVLVYETMVFTKANGKINYHDPIYTKRYTNYEDAIDGHEYAIKNIEDIIKKSED